MPVTSALRSTWVDDRRAALVILRLRDPHLLESGKRRQNTSANPDRVLALRWRNNLDLHGRRSQGGKLLRHALTNTSEHRGTARQNNIRVQVLANIDVALHDRLESRVVDAARLLADEGRLEEDFRAPEALVADRDHVAVRELVRLLLLRAPRRGLHLRVEIESHVRQLLLDVTNDLALRRRRERVTTLRQDLHHVLREVAPSEIEAQDRVREGVALIDRHRVRHAIAAVHNDAGGATACIERKNGLDGNVH